jgi:hypothetical protein
MVSHNRSDNGRGARVTFRAHSTYACMPCSLVDTAQCFREIYCPHHYHPDDGGSRLLRQVGKLSTRLHSAISQETAIFTTVVPAIPLLRMLK